MPFIRLTQKLQKEMGLRPTALSCLRSKQPPFSEWYAHLFFLNRRKQLIFVEAQTLFSFCLHDVSRNDIRYHFNDLFEKGLSKALFLEGVTSRVMVKVLDACRTKFVFDKTEDRRIIGVINEFIRQHRFAFWHQDYHGDTQDRCNRHMPMRRYEKGSQYYAFPIELFARVMKDRFDMEFTPDTKSVWEDIISGDMTF